MNEKFRTFHTDAYLDFAIQVAPSARSSGQRNDMKKRNSMRPVHPGEILREELKELGMSANALAEKLAVPSNRVSAILNGQRGVTADTSLRLSRYFGTTPDFWINLQKAYELKLAKAEVGAAIAKQVQPRGRRVK